MTIRESVGRSRFGGGPTRPSLPATPHRVIGIRDAPVGPLRDHLDENTIRVTKEEAMRSGLTEDDAQAVAEAALIAAAVAAHSSGRSVASSAPQAPRLRRKKDFDAETAWLAEVSQASSRSSIVPVVLRRHSSSQMNPIGRGE
ncbi:hypothetical protein P3102_25210 [Amycolatopsis sp. QT-25]|uniref:DUF6545 domain-containing protein n=1 Tax=Amycolatopsis sp. QT-25 TaxID=3034022 RepID=UPI0023EA8193|nr:DUF6545 domain-containing protein [Amycolatopsis sp. QT-25]WET77370.1 hypothetical protein P3102_25210 [Amycolatopsis sp. QT-25]